MDRAAPVEDPQTHTEKAQYLVVQGSAYNHTGVSRACHAPPFHAHGQYLVVKAPAASYHNDCLSARKPHTRPRDIPNIAPQKKRSPIKYETPNIRRPASCNRVPQIKGRVDYTTQTDTTFISIHIGVGDSM